VPGFLLRFVQPAVERKTTGPAKCSSPPHFAKAPAVSADSKGSFKNDQLPNYEPTDAQSPSNSARVSAHEQAPAMDPLDDLIEHVNWCTQDVFQKVLGWKAAPQTGYSGLEQPFAPLCITGSVSLAGKLTGVVHASFSETLAIRAAQEVHGYSHPLGNDLVNDVVGELTNMISGNLKAKMAGVGFACRLSIPTVRRGEPIAPENNCPMISVGNSFTFGEHSEIASIHFFARLETASL
jgi:chemotaxis protein CheX